MIDQMGLSYRQGMGNWQPWGDDVSSIQEAAVEWKTVLDGVELLCLYWKRKHGGKVSALRERDFSEGHFSQIKFDQYQRVSPNNEFRDLQLDLENNFQLKACAEKLQLEEFLCNLDHE